jgi:hypothetical protein
MPGLELWGHTWRWASDDLPFVSGLSALLYLTWVALLLVYRYEYCNSTHSAIARAASAEVGSLARGPAVRGRQVDRVS